MKKLFTLSLLGWCLVSCKVQKVKVYAHQHHTSYIAKIDTLPFNRCLYSTYNTSGEGSIITKCGCFFVGEEINHDCISYDTPVHPLAR